MLVFGGVSSSRRLDDGVDERNRFPRGPWPCASALLTWQEGKEVCKAVGYHLKNINEPPHITGITAPF